MIEDKTKEQQSASPAKPKWGQKLRSLWAQLQCMGLLHRHRLRRKTQNRVSNFSRKIAQNAAVPVIGEALYALGYSTEYAFVRAGRGLRSSWLWLWHSAAALLRNTAAIAFPGAAQMFRDLFGPIWLFFRGCGSLLVHAHRVRKEKGFAVACRESVHYLTSGVRRNIRTLPRMAMYVLPVCALAVMVTVFNNTIRQPYALEVQVNGQTVGYVANEDVFDTAREDVMERISYAGSDKTELTIEPSYTIAVAHHMLDENEMADAIIQSAGDQIGEGTALYLDGELTAVCSDGDALRAYFTSRLEPYEVPDDPNVSVGFNKQVTLEDGLYFKDSLQDYADVERALSGVKQAQKVYTVKTGDTLWDIAHKNDLTFRELCALNTNFKGGPLNEKSNIREGDELIVTKEEVALEVRITRIETREEEVAFAIETTKSNEYTKGTTKVLQEGQNGLRRVTFQNVYDTNNVLSLIHI